AVGRDEGDAAPDGGRGVAGGEDLAVDADLPGAGAPVPGEGVEQGVLPLALEGDEAEDLAGPDHEAHVAEHGARAEPRDDEARLGRLPRLAAEAVPLGHLGVEPVA